MPLLRTGSKTLHAGRVAGRLNGLKKWATEVQKWGGGFGGKSVTGRESKPQEEEERGESSEIIQW